LKLYKDLLKVTKRAIGYAQRAILALPSHPVYGPIQMVLAMTIQKNLQMLLPLAEKIMGQTTRRVIHGEYVQASDKIVSIFEPHTDIIKKDKRDTYCGHKVCFTDGRSNLISDCLIVEGNHADASITVDILDCHEQIYGRHTLKVAFDVGFASKQNLEVAKSREIKDVCFSKNGASKKGHVSKPLDV